MLEIFTTTEDIITDNIVVLATKPLTVMCGGVAIIALPAMILWTIYRSYLIMGGFSNEPFMTYIKDMITKMVIIIMATSLGFLANNFFFPIMQTQDDLAKDLSGSSQSSIFVHIEQHLSEVATLIEEVQNGKKPPKEVVEKIKENNTPNPSSMAGYGFWASKENVDSLVDNASSMGAGFWNFFPILWKMINLGIVFAGLVVLGISTFLVVIVNKIFFMFCIGFAPLFIMFLAFDSTKAWFSSWLNYTLGYCLAYPLIVLGVKTLLDIYAQLYSSQTITFLDAAYCFISSILFSVLIGRLGDLASSWFSAQNISDGTALAMAAMGKKVAGSAAVPMHSIGKGGQALAKHLYRRVRRAKIKRN